MRPPAGGGPQGPTAAFATRGRHTRTTERLRSLTLEATLVHPGASPDGAVARGADAVLWLAGELYNRDEIRSVLTAAAGAGASDAELVLGLFETYGLHAFRLLNGRYAAVLCQEQRVLLATDHAGSVPLYTRPVPGHVLAATEAKVLAAPSDGQLGFPISGARRIRRLPGLYQVPAGTALEIDLASGSVLAHPTWAGAGWRGPGRGITRPAGGGPPPGAAGGGRRRPRRPGPPPRPPPPPLETHPPPAWERAPPRGAAPVSRRIVDEDTAVEQVRTALRTAVGRRLAGTERPLVVLSGGIDSSGVAALADAAVAGPLDTLSMGTDVSDEFPQARVVAGHLGSEHREITIPVAELLAQLPHTIHAAESLDPDVIEYLLPLTALYRTLDGPARRVLTGYGADIPLGGMHREDRLPELDTAVARDMATFDGLNEMSPVLSTAAGHWSTHPYWDRDVLDLLTGLEAGLKRRYGRDKWVLRSAMAELLPAETVNRPKLGVHEGSGTTSAFSLLLLDAGVGGADVAQAKTLVVQELFDRTVVAGEDPDAVPVAEVVSLVAAHFRELRS
ncbi:asparagine synthase-related protein [Streptomyces sp. NPDC059456]|uniref:asparagine synthase-related protein n=1 Tax=Streptomyces sp. NPDC059456 TaxID=3346838 RepID=UPI0036D040D5